MKIYIGCGDYGIRRNAWYCKVAEILADTLSCEFVTFPGHHGEYMGKNYKAWANVLREIAQKAGWRSIHESI